MSTDTRSHGTAVLIGTATVAIAAIITVALLGGSRVTEYQPGTPEAAAQRYLQALFDADYDTAHDLLEPRLLARCAPHELIYHPGPDMDRAVFRSVEERDESVLISIEITSTNVSPEPIPMIDTHEIDTHLVLEPWDGGWRIVDAGWPLAECDWR